MEAKIYEKLREYCAGETYPFHMPGHKRNSIFSELLPGSEWDITEIGGFDNLHHAEGILKEAQERTAKLYRVRRTFFSVNGSTAALLAAISAAVPANEKILIARNCHKAVYHAVALRNLNPVYVYPQWNPVCGLNGGISPQDVENLLKTEKGIQAVVLTSPTYDGMLSDIGQIAEIVHCFGIPLIVDEAHGAHLPFSSYFPDSAISHGADLVIHSVHKTLPSLTQTALLHQVTERVEEHLLEHFMGIYQTSSPSYLLMGSIDACTDFLGEQGEGAFQEYTKNLAWLRAELEKLKILQVPGKELVGRYGIYDMDLSKIVISANKAGLTGTQLHRAFRRYHLEMEMEAETYVLALSSVGDSREGFQRLLQAAQEIEQNLTEKFPRKATISNPPRTQKEQVPGSALETKRVSVLLEESIGKISGEFAYLYPPGIPLLVPGEQITEEVIHYLRECQRIGLEIQGLEDHEGNFLRVL